MHPEMLRELTAQRGVEMRARARQALLARMASRARRAARHGHGAPDETGGGRPVDELDSAVVAQEQVLGDVGDRGSSGVVVATHGEHQLVLCRGQPDRFRLLLTEPFEAAKPGPELQQSLIVLIGDRLRHARDRDTAGAGERAAPGCSLRCT